jgi:hypothetical protein
MPFAEQTQVLIWFASIVLATGTILGFIKVWVVNPLSNGLDERVTERVSAQLDDKLAPITSTLEEIKSDVVDIRHEVNMNSGQSLKDQVIGLRGDLEEHRRHVGEKLGELKGRVDEHLHLHQQYPQNHPHTEEPT